MSLRNSGAANGAARVGIGTKWMGEHSARTTAGGHLATGGDTRPSWTMLTTHGAVLVYLSIRQNDSMRSMAAALQMTERTVASVIADLRSSGYIAVQKRGRTNIYVVQHDRPLPRAIFAALTLGDFLGALRVSLPTPPARSGTAAT